MAKQPKTFTWADFVSLATRFRRSVHLERDARDDTCLDGYIVTPLVRSAVLRMAEGLRPGGTARAWSITGPYGSGKSAFGVFLANVLGLSAEPLTARARGILAKADRRLADAAFSPQDSAPKPFGLVPVLVAGERRPLDLLVLEGLERAATKFWGKQRGPKPAVLGRLASATRRATAGRVIPPQDVVALVEEACGKIATSPQPGSGMFVVLDEAGKALEFAVQSPEHGDIQLLQELAEFANRSGDAPFVLAVILHQAFEQYAGRVNAARRNEWAKVQGRFEDIAFLEGGDQVLHLVGAALARTKLPQPLRARVGAVANEAAEACGAAMGKDAAALQALFLRCAPLNPVTALTLAPLFRSRLAQNERSLFAFLASNEPRGFQHFLRETIPAERASEWLYSVDRLYDYVSLAFGGRLYGPGAREWARIGEALHRLPVDADGGDARIIKTIGLLGFLGEASGLTASEEMLAAALCDGTAEARESLRHGLERLKRASIVVYRKYRDSYQLWEGSDCDIEALVQSALQQIDPRVGLADRLARIAKPRPLIARRHLLETGTLRHFEVRYVDDVDVPSIAYNGAADGAIWLALPPDRQGRELLRRELEEPMARLAETASDRPVVVVVPEDVDRLQELATDTAALAWVQAHAQGLQDDAVARREVAGRLAEAESQLRQELGAIMGGEKAATWHFRGATERLAGPREVAQYLSSVLDRVYDQAPHVHNEMLNRRHLSSSAAAARRLLLEAMLEHRDKARLNLEGFPPEYSMYASMLETHGFHRKVGGAWRLTAPSTGEQGSFLPAYRAAKDVLRASGDSSLQLTKFYDSLRTPPFGLHDGLLPVVLVNLFVELEAEVSIYEDGAFLPALTSPVIERLLRVPEKFSLQRVPLEGGRQLIFEKLLALFNQRSGQEARGLVPFVRQLVRFVNALPEYSRRTRTVSAEAQQVREALLRAREPVTLVFDSLPRACGVEPITPEGAVSEQDARELAAKLHAALMELRSAYRPQLLNLIEAGLREEFGLSGELKLARRSIGDRARTLLPLAADSELKALLIRLSDSTLDDAAWITSSATLLGGAPPEVWHDHTPERYRLNLGVLGRKFRALESFALDRFGRELPATPHRLLRVAVAQPGEREHERVVVIGEEDQEAVESLSAKLRALLANEASQPLLALAGLGLTIRGIIEDVESGDEALAAKKG